MPDEIALIALPIVPSADAITATEAALARRDELVLAAGGLKVVTTAEHAHLAGEHLRNLKRFSKDIEEARKRVKGPIDQFAAQIQEVAKLLTEAVAGQAKRIDSLLGTYQLEQQRLQREADEKARAEEQRILDEANAKAQKAIESGRNVDAKLEKIDAQAFDEVAEVRAQALAVAAPKVEGVSLRTEPDFEVLDIHAIYKARPDLVKLDVDRSALKSYLKKFPKAELPGVRHWTKAATSVRV